MQQIVQSGRPAALVRTLVVAGMLAATAPGLAQPCNPAVDGTYCAENGVNRGSLMPPAPTSSDRMPDMDWGFASPTGESPGMLGAITFGSDGTRCVGLLRRMSCTN